MEKNQNGSRTAGKPANKPNQKPSENGNRKETNPNNPTVEQGKQKAAPSKSRASADDRDDRAASKKH